MSLAVHETPKERFLGFMTVSESQGRGFFGGFLILNRLGHPLEFHCTAPVRPNKAQAILYGRSLKTFLCGDQIAPALYKKGKNELAAVLTDTPLLLTFQENLDIPLALILPDQKEEDENLSVPSDSSNAECSQFRSIPGIDWEDWTEGEREGIRFLLSSKTDRDAFWVDIDRFRKSIDLTEPFERINLAIQEAQRGG